MAGASAQARPQHEAWWPDVWNRDCNAAINIAAVYRHTYETGAPPPEFSRSYCGRPTPAWACYNYTWLLEKNKFKRIVA